MYAQSFKMSSKQSDVSRIFEQTIVQGEESAAMIWTFTNKALKAIGLCIGRFLPLVEITATAISLPVEERAVVVDSLLRSLNPPKSEIDKKCAAVVKQRLKELRSGEVTAVPGEKVFQRIWQRFLLHPEAESEFKNAIDYHEEREAGADAKSAHFTSSPKITVSRTVL